MNVLSLFDGMSCGQIALERAGIQIDNYWASEVDKYAIQVTQENYPDTIQIGNVNDVDFKEYQGVVELMFGGSPCQDLSQIKNDGKGLEGEKSKVFFRFVDALNEAQPKHFLYENVASMKNKDRDIITSCLGVEPVQISSRFFSAQDRPRYYWTNIPFEKRLRDEHHDVLMDIMDARVDEKYYYDDKFEVFDPDKREIGSLYKFYPNGKRKFTDTTSRVYNTKFKAPTLTAVSGGHQEKKVYTWDKRVRKLTPLEYERLQTVPEGYTSSVSDSQRYKMLGNGWTVDVIAHIFKGLKGL